jgi:hypothetical protein
MYLIFPESMIIPEVSNRREDYDFEDWLTAALIENANQDGLNGNASSARGITDLWMLEIAERKGRVWRGNFHVEFDQGEEQTAKQASLSDPGDGVLSFSLDTATGEMTITSQLRPGRRGVRLTDSTR